MNVVLVGAECAPWSKTGKPQPRHLSRKIRQTLSRLGSMAFQAKMDTLRLPLHGPC